MENDRLLDILSTIEKNQRELIDLQRESIALSQQRFAESTSVVQQSMQVQQEALRRQKFGALVACAILGVAGYLAVRWHLFF